MAHQSHASALWTVFPYSLESSRHWPNQAKVRSTRQRNRTGAKPLFLPVAAGLWSLGLGSDVQFHAELLTGDLLGLTLVGGIGGEALDGRMALAGLGNGSLTANPLVFVEILPDMDTFRADLARVEIPFIDEQGRRADFYSLRHTFCTLFQAADVSERCTMELMRHSDRKLTNRVYTDSGLIHVDEAVLKLPNVEVLVIQIRTYEFFPESSAPLGSVAT